MYNNNLVVFDYALLLIVYSIPDDQIANTFFNVIRQTYVMCIPNVYYFEYEFMLIFCTRCTL